MRSALLLPRSRHKRTALMCVLSAGKNSRLTDTATSLGRPAAHNSAVLLCRLRCISRADQVCASLQKQTALLCVLSVGTTVVTCLIRQRGVEQRRRTTVQFCCAPCKAAKLLLRIQIQTQSVPIGAGSRADQVVLCPKTNRTPVRHGD